MAALKVIFTLNYCVCVKVNYTKFSVFRKYLKKPPQKRIKLTRKFQNWIFYYKFTFSNRTKEAVISSILYGTFSIAAVGFHEMFPLYAASSKLYSKNLLKPPYQENTEDPRVVFVMKWNPVFRWLWLYN